jgi:hypothetical protein
MEMNWPDDEGQFAILKMLIEEFEMGDDFRAGNYGIMEVWGERYIFGPYGHGLFLGQRYVDYFLDRLERMRSECMNKVS